MRYDMCALRDNSGRTNIGPESLFRIGRMPVKDKGEKVRRLRPRRILLLTVVLLLLGPNFTLRCFHRTLAGFESEGTWELSMLCEGLSAYNADDIRRGGWTLFH